ncbi:hypothetical protein DLJ49_03475 [Rhodovulum sp. 12E13]|uniref:hypothetical protein n=1 Tax=Rhodovulum sp. 12E13 TaxID=2203891 RepID=UPI000E147B26|nr:hypothetical protein [Rhodovulum sp. 12E13]RDC74369.1 hypothetical protein DLJ49_03475 [Rhodovulum sp. 12E13]
MTQHRLTKPDHYIDVPEAVGVFDSFETLQQTIYDLMMAGFSRYDISVLGGHEAMAAKFGRHWWTSADLEDEADAPRAAFVSEEAIGELEGGIVGGFLFVGSAIAMTVLLTPASTLLGSVAAVAVGGTPGAVLGTLLARRVNRHHKDYYAEQIAHGGILVWVRVNAPEKERIATEIMRAHSGRDVHVHGWSEP